MKTFLILHFGFEKPGPDEMAAWNRWFESIAERQVERAHLPEGRQITADGGRALPMGPESLTGYTMIHAESLDDAEAIARECPIVRSTRVYEMMGRG